MFVGDLKCGGYFFRRGFGEKSILKKFVNALTFDLSVPSVTPALLSMVLKAEEEDVRATELLEP